MGRLDQLDLSLKLSRNKEAGRLAAGQQRLLQLRLHLGGLIGDGRLGPPVCNRKERPAHLAAVEEMVERTDKPYAPSKRWARIAAG